MVLPESFVVVLWTTKRGGVRWPDSNIYAGLCEWVYIDLIGAGGYFVVSMFVLTGSL
jgi:hypothetical protein